jgi:hypothetical protein
MSRQRIVTALSRYTRKSPLVGGPQARQISSSAIGDYPSRQSSAFSRYDSSQNWRDWFDAAEYTNAWGDDIEPLNGAPVLDVQSRMVLDLLNKLYQVGLTTTADRVTTDRVHVILQQLEDLPQQDSSSMWQRAERGRVLLEAMEQFDELRNEADLPIPLPLPTHETYWRVLRMYGSKFLSGLKNKKRNPPETCYAIVQRMADSGRLELQPTSVHWNQVLSAYANSADEKRPIHVASLLYDLDAKGMTDASSFSHALRACSATAARRQILTPYFADVATPLARRIWAGLKKSPTIDMQPYHYTHMLRVFRNVRVASQRDESVEEVFMEAIQAQKVNIHVLNEFLEVATLKLQLSVLGEANKHYFNDPETLIRKVPTGWLEKEEESGKSPYQW